MADLDQPLNVGDMIEVSLRSIGFVSGIVVWISEGRASVAVNEPVDPVRMRVRIKVRPQAEPPALRDRVA